MHLQTDEQPVNEFKDKPDNNPAPAKVDELINLRREIIAKCDRIIQIDVLFT